MAGADYDGPRRINARRGLSLSYQGKTLLSTIDPQGQADRLAEAAPKLERTLYFCPSPLYGYGLERLLEGLGPGSAVLCVEAGQELMALSIEAMGGLLREQNRLRLVRTADPLALCEYVRKTWGTCAFRRLETLRLSGGWQIAAAQYEAMAETLRREIALEWGNAMTVVKLGRRYLRNTLRNLALLPGSAGVGELGFGNAPALVLGAGPSLDGILDRLPRRAGRAFRIICVDTALPALRDRNIRPDLAAALESQHWNLRDFIGMGDWNVPLAMDLSALPATAGMLGGDPRLFFTPWADLRIFTRLEAAGLLPERFPPLGSVGLTAAALARRLTSGPIIVGGIDFSFTLDSFHARSSPSRIARFLRQNRLCPLIDAGTAFRPLSFPALSKTGLPVRSDPALRGYRDLFEREFAGDPRFKDADGPGLPLGLETVDVETALGILDGSPVSGFPEPPQSPARNAQARQSALEALVRREGEALITLREILQGNAKVPLETLENLLDEADYLWAHFPDCTGGRRPGAEDVSFLKRVRVEIDPCIRIFDTLMVHSAKAHS